MFGGLGVVAMCAPAATSVATVSVVVGLAAALVIVAATAVRLIRGWLGWRSCVGWCPGGGVKLWPVVVRRWMAMERVVRQWP